MPGEVGLLAEFFDRAEEMIVEALRRCAAHVHNGQALLRRLFAERCGPGSWLRRFMPAAVRRGPDESAFRRRKQAFEVLHREIVSTDEERPLYCLRRVWAKTDYARGFLGAITSRTGFFLTSFKKWREEILLHEARPTVFADLGYGVLDFAMVETAAYCLVKCE